MSIVIKESIKYTLRSRPMIAKEIKHVEWLYSLSVDELEAYKEEQFFHIFRKAYRQSPYYRKLYQSVCIDECDIQSLADIEKLPILTKDMVRQNSRDMLTVPHWMVVKANTSGTTGTPLTAYHSYKAIRLEQAYNWVRRSRYGFRYGEKLVSLRGNLGHDVLSAYVPASNTLYLSSYLINEQKAEEYYALISRFKPEAIEGYPSSLFNLALILKDKGHALSIPFCFTSSETLFPFQRSVIDKVFGTRLYDRYGCTERSVSFAELVNHGGYYEEPGYSVNEFGDDFIVTTSLINSAFPLIKYRVDDVVRMDSGGCIRGIDGRKDDVIVCKDGVKVGRLDHIFKGIDGVSVAQIVQKEVGVIEINIVPDSNFSDHTIRSIEGRLFSKIARNNVDVQFSSIQKQDLIYSSRNKFSLVKSYLGTDL